MSEARARLERLRRKRDAETDTVERADLEAAISALERELGIARVPSTAQHIGGSAQVGLAIAGSVAGNVYLNGFRSEDQARVLAAYLQRLMSECEQLPLHALADPKGSDERGGITLQAVYTKLATQNLVPRELVEGDALRAFDAEAYLGQHHGVSVLPAELRVTITPQRAVSEASTTTFLPLDAEPLGKGLGTLSEHGLPVRDITVAALDQLAKRADRLQFSGPELVTEAISANPRLVLLGEPGSGKSTALRHLALSLAGIAQQEATDPDTLLEGWNAGKLLPVYAPLLPLAHRLAERNSTRGTATDLWNYLAARLNGVTRPEVPAQHPGTAESVSHELNAGRVLLLLDGLDEVAGEESRHAVTAAVLAFAREHPACRIVVACRVRAYEGERNRAWQLPGWPTATLSDWTPAQMDAFVGAWYAAAAPARGLTEQQRDARAIELRTALAARSDLRRLGVRPLLLTIMALVHLSRDLPEDRASLYRLCIDKLLAEWEKRGKEDSDYGAITEYIGLPGRDIQALLPLLQQVAFAAHEAAERGSLGRIGRDRLRTMVMDALAALDHPNPWVGAERFLTYTDHRAGLLQASDSGDAYAFPHQTFQEYLAGVELVGQESFVQAVMQRRRDDRWETPIQLALGHLVASNAFEMVAGLFEALLEPDGRPEAERQADALLAASLATDLGWKRLQLSNATLRRQRRDLASALTRVVEAQVLAAADRVRAGTLLGELDDPRPGVCSLPPSMVEFRGGMFIPGTLPDEIEPFAEQFFTEYEADGNDLSENQRRGLHGTFQEWTNEQPHAFVAFALARYPVTNAQYRAFVDAGGYSLDAPWWDAAARAWLARDDAATPDLKNYQRRRFKDRPEWWDDERIGIARPNHPVVGVSWYEAMAFCGWLTMHLNDGYTYTLPSELEWEHAARGTEQRPYPWGEQTPDSERANLDEIYKGTTAVGCFPAGATPEGLYDMVGNVWEWTRSEYRPYPYDPNDGREDVAELEQKRFTFRGGGWLDLSIDLRLSNRSGLAPDFYAIGFRVARYPLV